MMQVRSFQVQKKLLLTSVKILLSKKLRMIQ
ncbi:hypothetical protein Pint_18226 [Pistacia integerrima]|uniref:Uncharacterized protein n=1 Tax=Pistacia integerrima TaxID=434235 RepID=A0ACC0YW76_9ROSI|nr:hypothetical protein Pint_18226 [Pistacia integerrima]